MYNLFDQFEIISYKGIPVRNLLTRISFSDLVKKTGAVYYPYIVADGERADSIAAHYYDDPRYSWLIYMSNDMFDPYYDWPLNQNEFNSYISNKYGSREVAMQTILFWRDNWRTDDTVKNAAGYAALSASTKKYFSPVLGYGNMVTSYVRTQSDKVVETNKTVNLAVSNSSIFTIGEIVKQTTSSNVTAIAQVRAKDTSLIVVNNVLGAFSVTGGAVSNVIKSTGTGSSLTSSNTISTSIPADELVYWEPVYAYTYEDELNNDKRSIRLIDKAYVDQIERELDDLV